MSPFDYLKLYLNDVETELNDKAERIAALENKNEDLQYMIWSRDSTIEGLEQRIAELELAA